MLKLISDDLKDYEADLKKFAFKAFPFATRSTINDTAFKAQEISRKVIKSRFVLRNKFTIRSVQVHKSKTLKLSAQSAFMGSTQKYMERQEFGGTVFKRGREGVSIPTGYSANQEGQKPRTKLPTRSNKLKNIRLRRRNTAGMSRKAANLIAVQEAAEGKQKYIYMDLGRKKGIFKVVGGKKNIAVKMVYDLTEQFVKTPKAPWLKPGSDKAKKFIPKHYEKALKFQLKRNGLANK